MKILIVCSYKSYLEDGIAPFISEQVNSTAKLGVNIKYFLIYGNGIKGYLSNYAEFRKVLRQYNPDLIHAHYGLCGLFANIQRKIPVITTYHGSDINDKTNYKFSKWSIKLSKWNIFVSSKQLSKCKLNENYSVIPCGVDTELFVPKEKNECRKLLGFDLQKKYILFSKAFHVKVKNYPLAKAAVEKIPNAELIELIGYSREEVCLLMNACDVALMTSFSEGSPQFIKEALSCNCPVVSTDVGDVKEIIDNVEGSYICSYEVDDVVSKLNYCLNDSIEVTDNRNIIVSNYSLLSTANRILKTYKKII